ncbi:MAG: carbohydrate ABC transporter permease [SAR324 cluster bacterium]|nr:carbohydrate ABC transporter permease [SAR324 cluster bacterium]
MIKEDIKIRLLVYIGLLVGLIFTLFPVFWIFISSVKTNTEVFAYPPSFIPENFTLSAYFNIFNDEDKLRFFFNSYFIAIIVTILTLLISILSGYSFSRFDFKLKRILNLSIISTQTIPPITLLIPYFGIVVTFKIFDTYLALILTYLVFTIPYATLMMTSYFNTLPKELDDAVLMDGGSNFTALCRVIIPISLPGIVATCVYTFLLCWNEFLFALTLTKSYEMRTVPIGIQLLMGQHAYEWNEMMAMSIIGTIPILFLYLFAQKYFLAGLTSGSVKF